MALAKISLADLVREMCGRRDLDDLSGDAFALNSHVRTGRMVLPIASARI
jgi:hypothetical protein